MDTVVEKLEIVAEGQTVGGGGNANGAANGIAALTQLITPLTNQVAMLTTAQQNLANRLTYVTQAQQQTQQANGGPQTYVHDDGKRRHFPKVFF